MATKNTEEPLSNRTRVIDALYDRAWELKRAKEHTKAEELCRKLLIEDDLGIWHRAGLHLILAHSNDQYVQHAEKAVELYEELVTKYEKEQREYSEDGWQNVLGYQKYAKKMLDKRKIEHQAIQEDYQRQVEEFGEPNQEELLQDALDALAEIDEKTFAAAILVKDSEDDDGAE